MVARTLCFRLERFIKEISLSAYEHSRDNSGIDKPYNPDKAEIIEEFEVDDYYDDDLIAWDKIKDEYCEEYSQRQAKITKIKQKKQVKKGVKLLRKQKNLTYKQKRELQNSNFFSHANLQGVDFSNILLNNKNLINTNLSHTNLKGKTLSGSNLSKANLSYANLEDADLESANLKDADLESANLKDANLESANLRGVKLNKETILDEKWRLVWDIVNNSTQGRNLQGADLQGADLQGADLWNANLRGANLRGANLQGADLWRADLKGANLQGANLQGINVTTINQVNQCNPNIIVSLISFGNIKMDVLRYVRKWTGLGLKETKDLIESAPVKFKLSVAPNQVVEFDEGLKELRDKGATIYICKEDIKLTPSKLNNLLNEVSSESTSSERLRQIFQSYFFYLGSNVDKIFKAMTLNPNTPLELLEILGEYYPKEFLENPVLDLYLLANPNLLLEISESTLISILRLAQTPKEFILFTLNNRRTERILKAILEFIIYFHIPVWNEWRKNNSDLINFDLSGVYFSYADLGGVDLSFTNLSNADLSNADLSNANLINANLSNADLSNADLSNANLTSSNLKDTNLKDTNLKDTNLSNADLSNADLSKANLTNANLRQIKMNKGTKIAPKWLK